jgi:hypothetical protein
MVNYRANYASLANGILEDWNFGMMGSAMLFIDQKALYAALAQFSNIPSFHSNGIKNCFYTTQFLFMDVRQRKMIYGVVR